MAAAGSLQLSHYLGTCKNHERLKKYSPVQVPSRLAYVFFSRITNSFYHIIWISRTYFLIEYNRKEQLAFLLHEFVIFIIGKDFWCHMDDFFGYLKDWCKLCLTSFSLSLPLPVLFLLRIALETLPYLSHFIETLCRFAFIILVKRKKGKLQEKNEVAIL